MPKLCHWTSGRLLQSSSTTTTHSASGNRNNCTILGISPSRCTNDTTTSPTTTHSTCYHWNDYNCRTDHHTTGLRPMRIRTGMYCRRSLQFSSRTRTHQFWRCNLKLIAQLSLPIIIASSFWFFQQCQNSFTGQIGVCCNPVPTTTQPPTTQPPTTTQAPTTTVPAPVYVQCAFAQECITAAVCSSRPGQELTNFGAVIESNHFVLFLIFNSCFFFFFSNAKILSPVNSASAVTQCRQRPRHRPLYHLLHHPHNRLSFKRLQLLHRLPHDLRLRPFPRPFTRPALPFRNVSLLQSAALDPVRSSPTLEW